MRPRATIDRAKQDYAAALEGKASDAGSKANQATAKVRLSLLSEAPTALPPRTAAQRAAPAGASRRIGAEPPAPRRAQRPAGASRW